MSKKSESNSLTANRNKLVPRLRFPEFKNSEEWERYPLEKFLIKNTKKNRDGKYTLIQSISNKHGFINQEDYFDNRFVASKNISNYYIIERGTFAYNPSRIDVGSLAYKFDDKTSIISPLYISFKSNPQFLEDLFLLFWFDTIEFYKQMKVLLEGGVRNILSFENLAKIKISYPTTLSEQQKIADCLSSIDEVITAETQKLEALKQHKKGLLQNLFPREGEKVPRLRFPEFKDSGEWEEKKLGEIAEIITERAGSKNYTAMSVTSGVGLIPQKEKFGKNISGNQFKNYFVIRRGDFAYNKSSTKTFSQGYIAMLKNFEEAAVPNSIFTCFKVNKELVFPPFLDYLFQENYHGKYLKKYIEVGARAHGALSIEPEILINMPITLPNNEKHPLREHEKIVSFLSSLDELIYAQNEKIEALKNHKKGLLQGLFPEVN